MAAKEVPGIANVLFALLKGNLVSDRGGLISHTVLMELTRYVLQQVGPYGFHGFLIECRLSGMGPGGIKHAT